MSRKKAPPVDPGMKWCFTCTTAKPVSEFRRHRRMPDGLSSQCATCLNSKKAERRKTQAYLREFWRRYEARYQSADLTAPFASLAPY